MEAEETTAKGVCDCAQILDGDLPEEFKEPGAKEIKCGCGKVQHK